MIDSQQLALRFYKATEGLGHDEKEMNRVLRYVARHQMHDQFNASVRQVWQAKGKTAYNAMDVVNKELNGNALKRLFWTSKQMRAEDNYKLGRDTHRANGLQYTLEGLAKIPYGLFESFKKHPVMSGGVLLGVAFVASFVPPAAALLSAIITGLAAVGLTKSALQAFTAPVGSEKRAQGFVHMGESLAAIGINLLPMAEVAKKLSNGRAAFGTGYRTNGFTPAVADEAHALKIGGLKPLQMLRETPRVMRETGKELFETILNIPADTLKLCKECVGMAWDIAKYPFTNVQKFAKPAEEFSKLKNGVTSFLLDESNAPEIARQMGEILTEPNKPGVYVVPKDLGRQSKELLKVIGDAMSKQVKIIVTLIDEAMVPFLKAVEGMKSGGAVASTSEATSHLAQHPTHAGQVSFIE